MTTCIRCSKKIIRSDKHKVKYCSTECRMEGYRARIKAEYDVIHGARDPSPTCIRCSQPIIGRNKGAQYCSKECRHAAGTESYLAINGEVSNLPSGTVGAIHELAVSIDLLRNGYLVFRSLSPSCPVDLVVLYGAAILRVEVTTGTRRANNALTYPPHHKNKSFFDVIAVVERNGNITYIPALPPPIEPITRK